MKNELKVGDRVSGKNLNGKAIAGKIVNIPRVDPSIAHVQLDGYKPGSGVLPSFAKIEELSLATEPQKPTAPPAAPAKPASA
jgi:hypothetical protein